MPIKLDAALLDEVGLGELTGQLEQLALRTFYDLLQNRVGVALSRAMSTAQLDEFQLFVDNRDDAGAFSWLETNFPDYRETVMYYYQELKTEIANCAEEVLAFVPPSLLERAGRPKGGP